VTDAQPSSVATMEPPPPPLPPAPPATGELPPSPEPPLTGVVIGPWAAVAYALVVIAANFELQVFAGSDFVQQGLRTIIVSVAGPSTASRDLLAAIIAGGVAVFVYALMLAPAVVLARIRGVRFSEAFGLRRFRLWQAFIGALGLVVGGISVMIVYGLWMRAFGVETPSNTVQLVKGFGTGPVALLIGFATVSVIAPIVEEVTFRGVVFAGLQGRLGAVWAALASGLLFGIVHLQPLEVVPLALIGAMLAWIFAGSKSLWPAIIAHGVYNAVVLTFALTFAPLVR